MIGGNLVYIVNQLGQIVAWDPVSAHMPASAFHELIAEFADGILE